MDTTQEQLVGEEIRRAREALHLSKRKAAERAGISESRWRQVESGVQVKAGVVQPATTTADTLVRIAGAVSIDPEHLLEVAGFPAGAAEVVTQTPPLAKGDVIDLGDFPEHERELLKAFASGLKLGRQGK